MHSGPTLETIGISGEEAQTSQPVSDPNPKLTESTDKPDQFEIDHSLDDLDDEELDSYIVTDEEFQQKKKAWLDLYAAFLEEQKSTLIDSIDLNIFECDFYLVIGYIFFSFTEKEEEKLSKEKEDGKGDKKRKRQKRTKGAGAATAGK